jgi:hypothetical protein
MIYLAPALKVVQFPAFFETG